MKHTHGEGVLVFALFASLAGCSDPVSHALAPSAGKQIVAEPAPPSAERVALTKIARLVAVAMDNEPARQRLKRDMKAAPYREHKLQLTSYLKSKDGKALLDQMVALSDGGESELFGTLATVRPLELYMPVAKHRESWTGKRDVLVVSQLDESEALVAFDKGGVEVVVDRNTAPEQPALSIVPVETRFDQPISAVASRNVRDGNGAAIGTLEVTTLQPASLIVCGTACEGDGGGGGGGGGSSIPPGLYLEFSRILDVKEPWVKGDPEIEVHIHGPTDPASPRYGADLSCSGENTFNYLKVFNQDDGFWSGRVMLFSAEERAAYADKFSEGFHVFFWEDDNQPCTLKYDTNSLLTFVQTAAAAFGTVAIKALPTANWPIVAGAFVATLFSNVGSWLLTDDDFLGIAVEQGSAGYAYPGNTHVIMAPTGLNGRATIVSR